MRFLSFILLFLFLHTNTPLWAQHPTYWQITDDNGLPSMTIYDLFQDSKGFIWLGTDAGIARYDGNKFNTFKIKQSKSNAMSYIQESKDGKIWFMNFSGQIFHTENDSIVAFEVKDKKGIENLNFQYFMINKEDDTIWFCTNNGWYSYDFKTKQNTFLNISVGTITQNLRGKILISQEAEGGVAEFYQNKWTSTTVEKRIIPSIYRIFSSQKNTLLSCRATKSIFEQKNNQWVHSTKFELLQNQKINIIDIRSDTQENIFILTFSGIYAYNNDLEPLYTNEKKQNILLFQGKGTSDILQDREGNYWVSTLADGLFFMPSKEVLHYNKTFFPALSDDHISKITKDDDNNLLLGLNNGRVAIFNPKKNTITNEYNTGNIKEIEAIKYDTKNKITIIGCGETFLFEKNKNTPLDVVIQASAPKEFTILDNALFIACATGISIASLQQPYNTQPPFSETLSKRFVDKANKRIPIHYTLNENTRRTRTVFADNLTKKVWLGYADGLFCYKNGEITEVKWDTKFSSSPQDKKDIEIKNNSIYAKTITYAGNKIYVGTLTQGIFIFENEKPFKHISTSNGLPSNLCNKIVADDNQNIWIGTDKGVVFLDTKTYEMLIYSRQDGLLSEQINDLAIVNNNVWLATSKGLLKLPISQKSINTVAPQIYISDLFVWEKQVPLQSSKILNYDENNLKIAFQGLSFRSRGVFKYKYRMLGIDTSWVYSESVNNFARYPSLPAGKFEFQVKSVNEDGVESIGTAIVEIEVIAPFWKEDWFSALLFTFFALLIYWIVTARLKQIQKENKFDNDIRESQLSALKAQMNPHFIFNALNSIQEFILLNEKRLANQFLGKFADLMRLTLDMSNKKTISLTEEIKILNLYLELEKLRFENLEYVFEIDENINTDEINLPAMLIQPYIENALKHGLLHKQQDRKLFIRFFWIEKPTNQNTENNQKNSSKTVCDKVFCCEIEDNGIGRERSASLQKNRPDKHQSFAMSATQKRLELLNHARTNTIFLEIKDLKDNQNNAVGTKIILHIPA